MDADRGGRAGDEKKPLWPEVTSSPATAATVPGEEGDGDGREGARTDVPGFGAGGPPAPAANGADPRPGGSPAAGDRTPADPPTVPGEERAGGGIAALSLPYQIVAAWALSAIALLACGHLAVVFLYVAPSNTLTKQYGNAVDDWVNPEFEQNWKLFAPNPLQQNIAVHVRAEVVGPEGRHITGWRNLSREDGEAIRGNLLPSHTRQNELRRAWDFYTGSHDDENRPDGLRGELSERYIRRIAVLRLSDHEYGGTVERIQIRSVVRAVGVPAWSDEKISDEPAYRELPWWTVTPSDLPEGARSGLAPAGVEGAR
ncbi:DUF5819 family protein [Streptomyces sp. NBC_01754]|uniref:DUF5819 family protein n=1 Tax=Streptomyces sp. NBC_01754 TaxID=2975930 RepID=UPI002DD8F7ED|nr:DUF5819 family protein [Streptomyces sp. NBC_01754]WSC96866.1 DUF5819 family protein [Streptomyces sp. NBC_01754]